MMAEGMLSWDFGLREVEQAGSPAAGAESAACEHWHLKEGMLLQ